MTERNESLRELFNRTLKENGLLLRFASKKIGIAETTISSWRHQKHTFTDGHLDKIQAFCNNY